MDDVRSWLSSVNRMQPPADLWAVATERAGRITDVPPHGPSRGSRMPSPGTPTGWRRALIVVVAFALFALAGAFAWRIINRSQPTVRVPVATPSAVPDHLQAQVIGQIDVGPFPQAIAVGEGGVWVDVPANAPGASPEIVHIDPSSDRVVARIPVPEGESDIAAGEGAFGLRGTAERRAVSLSFRRFRSTRPRIRSSRHFPTLAARLRSATAICGRSPLGRTIHQLPPFSRRSIPAQARSRQPTTRCDRHRDRRWRWLRLVDHLARSANREPAIRDPGTQVDVSTLQVLHHFRGPDCPSSDSPSSPTRCFGFRRVASQQQRLLMRVDPAIGETVGESDDVGDGLPFADAFGHLLLMSERVSFDLNPASGSSKPWPSRTGGRARHDGL